jgi:hypothetical protein
MERSTVRKIPINSRRKKDEDVLSFALSTVLLQIHRGVHFSPKSFSFTQSNQDTQYHECYRDGDNEDEPTLMRYDATFNFSPGKCNYHEFVMIRQILLDNFSCCVDLSSCLGLNDLLNNWWFHDT